MTKKTNQKNSTKSNKWVQRMRRKNNLHKCHIFVGVNPRPKKGLSGDECITTCRNLVADFDYPQPCDYVEDALERVAQAGLPAPTAIVFTGHGCHLWYRLLDPIGPDQWCKLQKRLSLTLDSDPKICNPERVMRFCGFKNWKIKDGFPDDPADVILLHADPDCRYALADIECHLKPLPEDLAPVAQKTSDQTIDAEAGSANSDDRTVRRAKKYAGTWEHLAEGKGRDSACYHHACQLVNDFALDDANAKKLLGNWDKGNKPPLGDAVITEKIANAHCYGKGKKGSKLTKQSPADRREDRLQCREREENPTIRRLEETMAGNRRLIALPWNMTNLLTKALLPGTITLLVGGIGAGKSLWTLQLISHLVVLNVPCSIFELEEDVAFHTIRALAQRAMYPELTDPSWIEENPGIVRATMAENAEFIKKVEASMIASPTRQPTKERVSRWVRTKAREGARVIILDPITATRQDDKVWVADSEFMDHVKKVSVDNGVSVLIVTHAKKGSNSFPDLDSIAGSTSYARFAQTVLWLQKVEPTECEVRAEHGPEPAKIDRVLHILKARNSTGEYSKMGFSFDPMSLRFAECGGIINKKNERKSA
jgi:hypothetical protein